MTALASDGTSFDLDPLKEVIGMAATQLTPNIYIFIPVVQQLEAERAKEMLEARRMKKAKRGPADSKISVPMQAYGSVSNLPPFKGQIE